MSANVAFLAAVVASNVGKILGSALFRRFVLLVGFGDAGGSNGRAGTSLATTTVRDRTSFVVVDRILDGVAGLDVMRLA